MKEQQFYEPKTALLPKNKNLEIKKNKEKMCQSPTLREK